MAMLQFWEVWSHLFIIITFRYIQTQNDTAQSAGAVEYTGCISAGDYPHPHQWIPDMTLIRLL